MADFSYTDMLPIDGDATVYRQLTSEGVRLTESHGRSFLEVDPQALTLLSETAFHDIAFYLRDALVAAGFDAARLCLHEGLI